MTPITQQLQSYATTLGRDPAQGSRGMELTLDFDTDDVFTKEFFQEQSTERIDFMQSVYIDNSLSTKPLTLAFGANSVFQITVKPTTQGFYPLPCLEGPLSIVVSKPGVEAVKVNLIFYNCMLPYVNWATQ